MLTTQERPAIAISTRDYDRLIALAMAAERRDPALAEFLTDELERAELVDAEALASNVVTMYSHVEFLSHSEQKTQCVTLVYPGDENVSEGKISVLTPIGAALIGLSEGQSINWQTRSGQTHRLTIMKVHASAKELAAG